MIGRIAVLSDIHANMPALQAVLAEVEQADVDLVVFGGDVAAGPWPVETIERLATYRGPARFVRGNADRFMVEIFDGIRESTEPMDVWSARRLQQTHRDFLGQFESFVELRVDRIGLVVCCHASPGSDELPIITPATPEAAIAPALSNTAADLIVAGHTHMQFDRLIAKQRMVNAGSVGMPYANQPGAYWALIGPDVQLRRTSYDFGAAAQAVLASEFPERHEFAEHLARPLTPKETIPIFERMAGRA